MRIGKFVHAALPVSDLDRAKEFYGGLLGLREKPRHKFNHPGAWCDLGEFELHLMVANETMRPIIGVDIINPGTASRSTGPRLWRN